MSELGPRTPEQDVCPLCGMAFKRVVGHWAQSSKCSFPDYPGPLLDITRGLLSVAGGFVDRADRQSNVIQFGTRHRDKALTLRHIYGAYGNQVDAWEYSGTDGFIGDKTEEPNTEHYQLRLSPNPALQSYRDIDFKNAGEFANKALLFLRAVKIEGGSTYRIHLPLNRTHRFESVFSEYHNKNEWTSKSGTDHVTYSIYDDVVEKYRKLGWPTGWWNQNYRVSDD